MDKAWLVYSVDGSQEQRKEIRNFNRLRSQGFTYTWELSKEIKDLQTENNVTFAIEVSDHYPSGQQHIRRSASRKLSIVDDERYLQWYRAELAMQLDEVNRARTAEKTSSLKVKEIKKQEGVDK